MRRSMGGRVRAASGPARASRWCAAAVITFLALSVVVRPLPGRAQSGPAASVPVPEALQPDVPVGGCLADAPTGDWAFLSDLPWTAAQSGWPGVADVVAPERGASFSRQPLVVGGVTFAKGLGTYPLTEITYDLAGQYTDFQAQVGVNNDAPAGAAAVFLVYADGQLVFASGVVRVDEAPRQVDVCVAGVKALRLVTARAGQRAPVIDLSPAAAGTFADWADARVFRPRAVPPAVAGAVREALDRSAASRRDQIVGELGAYAQQAGAEWTAIASLGGLADVPAAQWPAPTQAYRDASGRVVLANRRLALALGVGGADNGSLTALDPTSGTLLLSRATSGVGTPAGDVDLARGTVPDGDASGAVTLARIDDPLLGPGGEARATFRLRDVPDAKVEVRLALYDDRPVFTYQVTLAGWSAPPAVEAAAAAPPAGAPPVPLRLDYLSGGDPAFVAGETLRYFADASYVRQGEVADDGLWRTVRLGVTKPAAIWGTARPPAAGNPTGTAGLVLALLDEQRVPAWLVLRRDRAHAAAVAGIAQPLGGAAAADGRLAGPRLYVEATATSDLRAALTGYRAAAGALYPPAPLPAWVRYQWGSWWVYGSAVDEARVRRQIDYIAENLADLGPWHVLIDAGWQDVGPAGSDDLRRDSRTRFPSGVRALVDYAHARGVNVILFYSAVYAHDGSDRGEWLGLPGLFGAHPDWFRQLTAPGVRPARFLFDYANPATRDYLTDVLTQYVTTYGADGVKIDGLGDVEGQLVPFGERARTLPNRWNLTPVMDVYRLVSSTVRGLKPDAFIESGWVNPTAAQPLAHVFRSGDEGDAFSQRYPFPGLAEHVRYAAVQETVLGQRPNVGAVYGSLDWPLQQQWLAASLALGAPVSVGSDLTRMTPGALAAARALLVQFRPFTGTTRSGGEGFGLAPSWVATTTGDVTFAAVLNDGTAQARAAVSLVGAGAAGSEHDEVLVYAPLEDAAQRARSTVTLDVPAQSLVLAVMRRTPGVVWTTSAFEAQLAGPGWRHTVQGPAAAAGRLLFYLPGGPPARVSLDGVPQSHLNGPAAAGILGAPEQGEGFAYDGATGLLVVRYDHRGIAAPRTIEIEP